MIGFFILGFTISASALGIAKNGPEMAQGVRPLASIPSPVTVTGTQTIADVGECSKTSITVTAPITGETNDGGGNDNVRFELWDDSVLKASNEIAVPVGTTQTVTMTLAFEGLYGTNAAGVGVGIIDLPANVRLYWNDPFIPTDVQGSCGATPVPALSGIGIAVNALALAFYGVYSRLARRRPRVKRDVSK